MVLVPLFLLTALLGAPRPAAQPQPRPSSAPCAARSVVAAPLSPAASRALGVGTLHDAVALDHHVVTSVERPIGDFAVRDLEGLTRGAPTVIVGLIASCRGVETARRVDTVYQISVESVLKGPHADLKSLAVQLPGGHIDYPNGDSAATVVDRILRLPEVGERLLLFLRDPTPRADSNAETFTLWAGLWGVFRQGTDGAADPVSTIASGQNVLTELRGQPFDRVIASVRDLVKRDDITRVSAGNIMTPPTSAAVEDASAKGLAPRTEAVGGFVFEAGKSYCVRHPLRWELRRTNVDADVDPIVATGVSNSCTVSVAGLPPADYTIRRIDQRADDLPLGRTHIVVKPQEIARLTAPQPVVVARGIVVVSGNMAANRRISFSAGTSPVYTTTGDGGAYAVALPSAGVYSVLVAGQTKPVTTGYLAAGENALDVTIGGARISARFDGRRPSEHLQLFLVDGIHTDAVAVDRDMATIVRDGLPFGTYLVWAEGEHSTAAAAQTVVLDDAHPSASLTIRLIDHAVKLRLVDSAGAPITHAARLTDRSERRLPLSLNGEVELQLTPGVPLVVKSDDGVTCVRVTDATSQTAAVFPGTATASVLMNKSTGFHGAITGIPEATCPVNVDQVRHTWLPRSDGTFELTFHLPPATMHLVIDDKTYLLRVPGPTISIR